MARLTVEQADRLAQERPPYPPPSDVPAEQCPGPTGWHRPQVEDWNRGNRESACTWCGVRIERRFADPTWRRGTTLPSAARETPNQPPQLGDFDEYEAAEPPCERQGPV